MNKLMIKFIKFYRKNISLLFGRNKCRFTPTCSQYSIEAYEKYNFFKATYLSVLRILRCNPFSKGGYDPLK
ncbi:membrane protein insertion efficiency factor YidD [Helcococcus sueciensis]|uniref:membrane protein insertion efficiency factor YidD n=1 Tax=Helcococcus sueciensis TaxID=241555 RepID=UPI000A0021E3|nr:membrane protein insertion efficiency factor YidD [Helcococcus sueciensis]